VNTTSVSLLERLPRPDEPAAWERFVRLYTPLLCHRAGRLGLHGADAADLVQDVFAVLVQKLPEYRYDPQRRFRGWLWTILLNKYRARQRRPVTWHQAEGDALAALPAPPPAGLDEEEHRQYLVQRALQLMQAEFQPSTWKAFWESVVVGRPAAEVARALGLSENAVYLARGRVLRRLRTDLEGLLD
jgi:RNA polymerase sigma-70 factor (ECF subfamily)